VSLQLTTIAIILPSNTLPVPCVVPNPEPEIVTWVPAAPLGGVTLVTVGVLTAKLRALEEVPPCRTCTVPEVEFGATTATIWVSLQVRTRPLMLPSRRLPLPRVVPNPVPVTVTAVPTAADGEDKLVMFGPELPEPMVKSTEFDQTPP
jgi:hypothetical protein